MATKKKNSAHSNSGQDIYSLLHQDHERVAKLMQQIEKSPTEKREELFQQLKMEIEKHSMAEEIIVYPKLKEADTEAINEALDEHDQVDAMLSELEQISADSDEWMDRFTELKDAVEHHVEEEESEMFKVAREVFSEEQARELAEQVKFEKEQMSPA